MKIVGSTPTESFSPLPETPWKGTFYYGWRENVVPAFLAFRIRGSSLALHLDPLPLEGLDESRAFLLCQWHKENHHE
ncbi:MAG: hypothetical protein HOG15_00495 [Anaerolineae bacterium]|jgi:hypothetical protein|nr:hypothetical protein [Anaerolineae bacterium]